MEPRILLVEVHGFADLGQHVDVAEAIEDMDGFAQAARPLFRSARPIHMFSMGDQATEVM